MILLESVDERSPQGSTPFESGTCLSPSLSPGQDSHHIPICPVPARLKEQAAEALEQVVACGYSRFTAEDFHETVRGRVFSCLSQTLA